MLENKLGIQDAVELAKVEEQLSKKRAKELFEITCLQVLFPRCKRFISTYFKICIPLQGRSAR